MPKGKHVHDRIYINGLLSRSNNNLSRSDTLAIARYFRISRSLDNIRRNQDNNNNIIINHANTNNNNIINNIPNIYNNIIINHENTNNNNIINNIPNTNNNIEANTYRNYHMVGVDDNDVVRNNIIPRSNISSYLNIRSNENNNGRDVLFNNNNNQSNPINNIQNNRSK